VYVKEFPRLTLSGPAGLISPTYKESFQVLWDNSIPLYLHAAIYLEVSLFRWTSQNAFSRIQMILCAKLHDSIAQSIICTRLFRGKMHSDWFNGIEILQGWWQCGEKGGYCYPNGLKKTLCKWDICPDSHERVKVRDTWTDRHNRVRAILYILHVIVHRRHNNSTANCVRVRHNTTSSHLKTVAVARSSLSSSTNTDIWTENSCSSG